MAKRRYVRINHPVKGLVHPNCTGNETVKTLVWTVLSYGAEAWTLKMRDEPKLTYQRKRAGWMERTDDSILQELDIVGLRELLGHVRKRKRSYFGHLCRAHGCQITKTVVEGYVVEGHGNCTPAWTTSNSGYK